MIEIPIIKDAFEIYGRQYQTLGDYSATTLIDSPRRVALFQRYGHTVVHTPEAQAASIIGTSVHEKIEKLLRSASVLYPGKYVVERQVAVPYETVDGYIHLVAGRPDIYVPMEETLLDIKTCKTWKLKFDPDKADWTEQLNIYAFLLHEKGCPVKKINVIAFFLDWVEANVVRDPQYPKAPIMEIPINIWSKQEQYEFLMQRLEMHALTKDTPDDELPPCTREEMWQRDTEYAVFKDDSAKRAMKVLKDARDLGHAAELAVQLPKVSSNSLIEVRESGRKRCDSFCPINDYCSEYKKYRKEKKGGYKRVSLSPYL